VVRQRSRRDPMLDLVMFLGMSFVMCFWPFTGRKFRTNCFAADPDFSHNIEPS